MRSRSTLPDLRTKGALVRNMPSDKRERVRTLLGEKKFSEMDAAERALIADAAMAWVHGDAAVSHEPRSLSEFVRADEATRERIGAEVAAGAIERQQSSTAETLEEMRQQRDYYAEKWRSVGGPLSQSAKAPQCALRAGCRMKTNQCLEAGHCLNYAAPQGQGQPPVGPSASGTREQRLEDALRHMVYFDRGRWHGGIRDDADVTDLVGDLLGSSDGTTKP